MADSVDIKDQAFDWYIENRLATLRDVSEEFDIPYETVRDWAKNEGWVTKRVIRGRPPADEVVRQADGIRSVLYEEIVSGDARDLPDLVKAWLSTMTVQAPVEKDETVDRDSLLGG